MESVTQYQKEHQEKQGTSSSDLLLLLFGCLVGVGVGVVVVVVVVQCPMPNVQCALELLIKQEKLMFFANELVNPVSDSVAGKKELVHISKQKMYAIPKVAYGLPAEWRKSRFHLHAYRSRCRCE